MMRARRSGLAVAAALFAGPTLAAAQERAPESLNPLSFIDASALPGFRDRPPFAPSRRPPPATAEPAPPSGSPPAPEVREPNLRLTGVVGASDESVAVVQNLDVNETWRLRLGDSVGGWLVTAIDPMAMRLTLGEREREFRIFENAR